MNENKNKVVIIGAGGHAKVAIDILNYTGYTVVGIVDDNITIHGDFVLKTPILGGKEKLNDLLKTGVVNAFVAIGNNTVRVNVGEQLKKDGFTLVTAIHHSAIIADSIRIGEGSMIAAGGIINPDATVGKHVIINTGATIDHDCVISDGVHVSPGANIAGNVYVGEKTHIGIGSCVIQGINIGDNSIIGAGSVVVRDIESNVTAYGNPAKVRKVIAVK